MLVAGGLSFLSEADIRAAEIFEPPIPEVGFIGTVPQTARWLSLAGELAAETSAILVESCSLVRVRRDGELELCSQRSDEPAGILVGAERAIATVEEHAFQLGPPSNSPVVEVQRVTA